jgi:hypothetical protein
MGVALGATGSKASFAASAGFFNVAGVTAGFFAEALDLPVLDLVELFEEAALLEPLVDFVEGLLEDLAAGLLVVELLLGFLAVLLVDFAGAFLACVSSAVWPSATPGRAMQQAIVDKRATARGTGRTGMGQP